LRGIFTTLFGAFNAAPGIFLLKLNIRAFPIGWALVEKGKQTLTLEHWCEIAWKISSRGTNAEQSELKKEARQLMGDGPLNLRLNGPPTAQILGASPTYSRLETTLRNKSLDFKLRHYTTCVR
jgi:hypothetical protein